jgi:hypothetical protein
LNADFSIYSRIHQSISNKPPINNLQSTTNQQSTIPKSQMFYSCRNAVTGSMDAARLAGR